MIIYKKYIKIINNILIKNNELDFNIFNDLYITKLINKIIVKFN